MRRAFFTGVVSCLAVFSVACSASTEIPDESTAESETLGQSQDELKATSGNMLGSICRACGCSYVSRVIDGCTVYRCECSSTKDAQCVVNAPGSATLSTGDVTVDPRAGTLAAPTTATATFYSP